MPAYKSSTNRPLLKQFARYYHLTDGDPYCAFEFNLWMDLMSSRFNRETGWTAVSKPDEFISWLQKQEASHVPQR